LSEKFLANCLILYHQIFPGSPQIMTESELQKHSEI
jgi:hypothetical protein